MATASLHSEKWSHHPGLDERLIELHGNPDLSAQRIADQLSVEFNLSLSRNAVIGRTHRLKLAARPTPPPSKKPRVRLSVVPPPPPKPVVVYPAGPVSLLDLDSGRCKWPVSGPPAAQFCGMAQATGSPYCPMHSALAFNKPREG
jgi:GcrA cell cycle regulator